MDYEELNRIFYLVNKKLTGNRIPIFAKFDSNTDMIYQWHLERNGLHVTISDIFRDSNRDFIESLAHVLLTRCYRMKCPNEHMHNYQRFFTSHEIIQRSRSLYLQRNKNIILTPQGRYYNLSKIFDKLNDTFFDGKLEKPILGWTKRVSYQTFGFCIRQFNTIIINRVLDDYRVPSYVIEFVLYHEMLHLKHRSIEIEADDGKLKRFHHTNELWQDEIEFPLRHNAKLWISKLYRYKNKIFEERIPSQYSC